MGFIIRKLKKTRLFDYYIRYKQSEIVKEQEKVADQWRARISDYQAGKIEAHTFRAKKPELIGKKIIWQYWGQGIDKNLPDVILPCFESVDKYKGDYEVIRLDNTSVSQYLDFPGYVSQRLAQEGSGYNYTYFSDLLRLALLVVYGGVWMDATIYMTGPIPDYCFSSDWFMYQRDDNVSKEDRRYYARSYYPYWCWDKCFKVRHLNAFIVAQPNSRLLVACLDLLLYYWHNEEQYGYYFECQILINELLQGNYGFDNCSVVSDTLPHLLSLAITNSKGNIKARQAIKASTIHKLNSKGLESNNIANFLWLQRMQYQNVL